MKSQLNLFDTGDVLKDEGMSRALKHAPESWKNRFCLEAAALAYTYQPFTSEDVTRIVGQPPEGTSPNAVGAMMHSVAKALGLRRVGFVEAKRINQHSTMISKWQLFE